MHTSQPSELLALFAVWAVLTVLNLPSCVQAVLNLSLSVQAVLDLPLSVLAVLSLSFTVLAVLNLSLSALAVLSLSFTVVTVFSLSLGVYPCWRLPRLLGCHCAYMFSQGKQSMRVPCLCNIYASRSTHDLLW